MFPSNVVNKPINQSTINNFLMVNEYHYLIGLRLSDFNKKIVKAFEILKNNGIEIDQLYYNRIAQLTDYVNNKLNIENYEDFKRIISFIELSEILVNQGIEDNDFDCLTEGLYSLKSNLENFKIWIREWFTCI